MISQNKLADYEPSNIGETGLSEEFVKNLILKVVGKLGPTINEISEVTGLSLSIIDPLLARFDKERLILLEGEGGMTRYLRASLLKNGREYLKEIQEYDGYVGAAPVPYSQYVEAMSKVTLARDSSTISTSKVEEAFKGLYISADDKKTLTTAISVGRGVLLYGPPGNGKTTICSRLSRLLPPIIMPRCILYGTKVISLYDPDFHIPLTQNEQPKDRRWIMVQAPFVFTGPELDLEKLNSAYDPEKGVYVAPPQVKANGGILLLDDLGRQSVSHQVILNRLIVPMENKKDISYVSGIPVEVFTDFIPLLSTNLNISIFEEAHLRRVPFHIFLGPPDKDMAIDVFSNLLKENDIEIPSNCLEMLKNLFTAAEDGGVGVKPSYAVLYDVCRQIVWRCSSSGITTLDEGTLLDSVNNNVILSLQKQGVSLHQLDEKFKKQVDSYMFRIKGDINDLENIIKRITGIKSFKLIDEGLLVDLMVGKSITDVASRLKDAGVTIVEITHLGKTLIPIVDEKLLGTKT
jgi:predicted ATPase with chaperone activity